MTPLAKAFPEQSLHSVANYGVADVRANGDSQTGFRSIGVSRDNYEISGVLLFA